ncbi:ATP-grasp domain-containing protein [Cupriavidus basilensis]
MSRDPAFGTRKSPTTVVTGVGAIIGQGIVKSLRSCGGAPRVVGVDRNADSMGAFLCDAFYPKPRCDEEDERYLAYWRDLVAGEGVRLIIPGLEIDVAYLARHRAQFEEMGVTLCLNTDELIAMGQDKWALAQALGQAPAGLGALAIPALLEGDWASCTARLGPPPLLMKPRHGSAGRGIVRLEDEEDFLYWRRKSGREFMVQRIVGSDDEEYTVGVFGLGEGDMLAPIVFRRRLSAAGNTGYAEVVRDAAIERASEALSRHFRPLGPTNYQFRKEGGQPFLLEINPRFSSSTSLRTAFGYNEAAMSLEFYLHGRRPTEPTPTGGRAWRYSEDLVTHDRHPV